MPFTLNGVGTRYVGKKNLERFQGQCEFCRRVVMLENYETTECFVVLFIPLIPLGRKQVLNACPSCRKLRVASASKWREITNNTIDKGLANLAQNPNDPETVCRLMNTYVGFRQFDQAADLAGVASRQFPSNTAVQIQVAQCFEELNRRTEAEAAWKRALALEPQNQMARLGMILRQIDTKNLNVARQLVKSPPEIKATANPGLYLALGRAFQAEGSHREALDLFTESLAAAPRFANDKAFRSWVFRSEKALGVEQSLLPSIPIWRRTGVRWAAAIGAVVLAVMLFAAYLGAHRKVQVVNGFDVPVTFHIDNQAEAVVMPHGRQTVSVGEGAHHAQYKIGSLAPQEVDFTVSEGFFDRFGNSKVPVLNPGGGSVLVWEQAQYSQFPNGAQQPYFLFLGEDFFTAQPTDYLFEEFPQTIEVKSGQTITKARLGLIAMQPANVLGQFKTVPVAAQLRFAESHLQAAPDNEQLLLSYLGFAMSSQQEARCRDFLASRLETRPIHVEWHRAYQSLQSEPGDQDKLRAKYSELLKKDPKNSVLLYLRGRLEIENGVAMDYFQRAIDADPKNAYPWFAKGYQLMSSGDFAAAATAAAEAARLAPDHPQMRDQLFLARYALGDYLALEQTIRTAKATEPLLLDLQIEYLLVLAAEKKLLEASAAQTDYETKLRAAHAGDQAKEAELRSRCTLLYQEQKFSELLTAAEGAGSQKGVDEIKFSGNLELGRFDNAAAAFEKSPGELGALAPLCLSIGWRTQHDDKQADQWQATAKKLLLAGGNEERAVASMLDRAAKADPAEVKATALNPPLKAVLLVALAQQCPAHRAELAAMAKKLNFYRDRPYYFLQRNIAALEQQK